MNIYARQSLVDYLRRIAIWRRQRAEEYDRDERNLVVADGLEELAAYILELPELLVGLHMLGAALLIAAAVDAWMATRWHPVRRASQVSA